MMSKVRRYALYISAATFTCSGNLTVVYVTTSLFPPGQVEGYFFKDWFAKLLFFFSLKFPFLNSRRQDLGAGSGVQQSWLKPTPCPVISSWSAEQG